MIINPAGYIETARRAAREGAAVIRSRYMLPQEIKVKADSNTLVTETDVAAETAIIQVLTSESDFRILSEESGYSGKEDGPVWIVDPLDGTSNFARSLPLFAVSIALVHNNQLLAGVIADPVHDIEYYALKGEGAFYNSQPLIKNPQIDSIPVLIINHGAYAQDKVKFAALTNMLASNYNLRKLGTTALELCFVATGFFDGFICAGDEIWDYAAGALIAAEAGFCFTTWAGNEWDGVDNSILVCRPELQIELLTILSRL
ncbi:MAG TPA: inositol monophosphatase [Mariniphaga sp.]|nr:inositol monophosphatase [Mariniphaga sp.]